jgi:hypothetical protein
MQHGERQVDHARDQPLQHGNLNRVRGGKLARGYPAQPRPSDQQCAPLELSLPLPGEEDSSSQDRRKLQGIAADRYSLGLRPSDPHGANGSSSSKRTQNTELEAEQFDARNDRQLPRPQIDAA